MSTCQRARLVWGETEVSAADFGVPQRGTVYQPGVEPRVGQNSNKSVLKERRMEPGLSTDTNVMRLSIRMPAEPHPDQSLPVIGPVPMMTQRNQDILGIMKFGYLIDMDGVIYRENRLIPGAVEFVNALLSTGTPFLFLTNNSAPTAEDLTVRLRHLGVAGLSPKHFYTSAMNTADFLAETHPNCSVFVIGEGGLLTALHDYKIANDAIRPDYVVVGEGAATTEKLAKAHECIERGARLIATNPDNWCPVSDEKTRPGAGAITAFLEASTGSRAYYLGKPNGYMFHRARRKLMDSALNFSGPVAMIGDTMETDIRGAVEAGLHGFLVLTGSTQLENVCDYVYQPSRILQSVADLTEEILTGKAASHFETTLGAPRNTGGKSGHRHQTDVFAFHKPRPRPAMTK